MIRENHVHVYDEQGNQICCSLEEKIEAGAAAKIALKKEVPIGEGTQFHTHEYGEQTNLLSRAYLPSIVSCVLLLSGLAIQHLASADFFEGKIRLLWYVLAYLPVGIPVLKEAWNTLKVGEVFTEFFLMSIATIGAFVIGEYPEGVAVMLFYAIGELFQTAAVRRAKYDIRALLDVRPKTAHVLRKGKYETVHPATVGIGERIQVRVGEKTSLDGTLISGDARLNMAALTGESRPQKVLLGEQVMRARSIWTESSK